MSLQAIVKKSFITLAPALMLVTTLGWSQDLSVPRFEIAPSPIGIVDEVRPNQYVGVVGPQAAYFGTETGTGEVWVHPFKLVKDFQLSFSIEDYYEPIPAAQVATTIEVRPELTTITYTHATFTVKQHIMVPRGEPGVLMLLSVDAIKSVGIVVQFRSVFEYAWPGGLGGQYAFWSAQEQAFIFSESLRQRNGVIASPHIIYATDSPAHALPDAPHTFILSLDEDRTPYEFIPIAFTAGTQPRENVLQTARQLIEQAPMYYQERVAHATDLLAETTQLDTPDDRLDRAFAWAKINLDEQYVCNPDLGCGLVAGWGPSSKSARPGFGWFFGGDAAINSFAMDGVGLWPQVEAGLRFMATYQREDGKMPHEVSQSAGVIPWFTDFPYGYYHADTTPYWIVALWRYWRATGDDAFLNDMWPALERAYAWCLTTETDGDGIIENTTGGLGAVEVGSLGEGIHQDIYLAGVWTAALQAMIEFAEYRHLPDLHAEASAYYTTAHATLNTAYWRDEGYFAFGVLRSGGTRDHLTVWPATAGSFGLFESERGRQSMKALASDNISADWGARMLSKTSDLYEPLHYNNGAVWPFVTGFVSWAHYRYRRPWAGYPLFDAVAQNTFDWAHGRHVELMSGQFYRPLDTAVPHQFFATSMLVSPVMMGLLGWEPHAPSGRAQFAPQLPPDWDAVTVKNLSVGDTRIHANLQQATGQFGAILSAEGPAITLDMVLAVPPGATDAALTVDGQPHPFEAEFDRVETRLLFPLTLDQTEHHIELTWAGGLQVAPFRHELVPGQTSTGLRILDFYETADQSGWQVELEGQVGATYPLDLYGEPLVEIIGATQTAATAGHTQISVSFPVTAADRVTKTVVLKR